VRWDSFKKKRLKKGVSRTKKVKKKKNGVGVGYFREEVCAGASAYKHRKGGKGEE